MTSFVMSKKSALVYVLAFVLNWGWETWHSVFYRNYQNGPITGFILFRAALIDALIILGLIFVSQKIKLNQSLFVVFGGLISAVVIELWGLKTGQWAYNSLMPIIPIVKIGLMPTIQLAITGFIAERAVFWKNRNEKQNKRREN